MSQVPLADVFERGLQVFQKTPHKTTEAVDSQRSATVLSLKRYLWALGTVGSSAPFVGLFGTVVGILKAFQSMSVAGTGGFKVVSQGIAAALVATAAGLHGRDLRRHRLQLLRRAHQRHRHAVPALLRGVPGRARRAGDPSRAPPAAAPAPAEPAGTVS